MKEVRGRDSVFNLIREKFFEYLIFDWKYFEIFFGKIVI